MESSQVLGDSDQKCSDSESGWTMYIGSQICKENYGEADDDGDEKDNENKPISHEGGSCGGDESDDSMASDASSGPILHQLTPDGIKQGTEMFGHLGNTVGKCFSANIKPCKQEKKRDERRIKQEVPKADSAESQV
ncbi:hypothetical protein L484_026533 [Morus notabilis]|uniref:Uncharacterized protein n=1 Tax=Morus notabilis TaxID=981085 RepID=W9QNW3_9ROSA|nr:uncharacterized protein LOC21409184 [Morus notabilis]EXB44945.1 hypothetical protein L484_026533 [Morus notabilis]